MSMTFCFVPYHQEVLRAHQSRCGLRAAAEDPGYQIESHGTRTET